VCFGRYWEFSARLFHTGEPVSTSKPREFSEKEEERGIQKIGLKRGRCLKAKEKRKTIF
jgi:hypothetical protein